VRGFQGSLATTQHKRNPSMAHQAVVDNMFHGYMSNTGRRTHLGKAQAATNLELLRREKLPHAAAAPPWPRRRCQAGGAWPGCQTRGCTPRGASGGSAGSPWPAPRGALNSGAVVGMTPGELPGGV
jgi:hypothetical protein